MAGGQRTALQLVNGVLRRLGKSQVSDFTGISTGTDNWGSLVLDTLNEGQGEITKEHDWSTLYTSGTFTTSSRTYDLSTSFSDFGREVDLVDTTNEVLLTPLPIRAIDAIDPGQGQSGPPRHYTIQYPNLLFDRTPSAVSFRIRYLKRPTAFSTVSTVSLLPEYCDMVLVWWTVWQLHASREDAQDRGETARDIYEKSLARAIGQDRRRMDILWRFGAVYPNTGTLARPPANLGSNYEPV